jgi:hypothetical protein
MGSFGKGVGVILLGLVFRWIGTVLAASEPKFVFKEKAFLGFAWIPKATVQAAIGGIILNKANALPEYVKVKKDYVSWGKDFLSMAVVAVIITAPLGAILTNTLGVIWLSDDSGRVSTAEIGVEMTKSFVDRQNMSLNLKGSRLMKSDIAPSAFKYNNTIVKTF